jgi:hypothetical protein
MLPSRGRWYPTNTLKSPDGSVEVYSMTAADETKFKTNEVLMSSQATYDLIRSCVPSIVDPENIPIVDLDAILLSIRRASYDENITLKVPIPNTSLTDQLDLNIAELVEGIPNSSVLWDEELEIKEGENSVIFQLAPLTLKTLFNTTRHIMRQQQRAESTLNNVIEPDEKISEISQQLKTLADFAVSNVADSIKKISTNTGYETSKTQEIRDVLSKLDLEYFRAIKAHLEQQKKITGLQPVIRTTTPEQQALGAPATFQAEISFTLSNFFV